MVMVSSIRSRVVPCISLTMARSSCNKALSRVLLPTLGAPMIATGMPFFMALPSRKEDDNRCISLFIVSASFSSSVRSANSNSSWSEKSNSSSNNEVRCNSSSRSTWSFEDIPPRICCMATLCCTAVCDAITSATASACERSIFPLRYALLVNSPGPAKRQPFSTNRFSTWLSI